MRFGCLTLRDSETWRSCPATTRIWLRALSSLHKVPRACVVAGPPGAENLSSACRSLKIEFAFSERVMETEHRATCSPVTGFTRSAQDLWDSSRWHHVPCFIPFCRDDFLLSGYTVFCPVTSRWAMDRSQVANIFIQAAENFCVQVFVSACVFTALRRTFIGGMSRLWDKCSF